jgi:cyclophilin family peptidyl-prolyl cis-trans isomerase
VPSEYNDLSFKLGAVGIARGQDAAFNNDSQFFIVKKDSTFLDKQYTNFGQVTGGMDVVANVKIGDRIKKVTVE